MSEQGKTHAKNPKRVEAGKASAAKRSQGASTATGNAASGADWQQEFQQLNKQFAQLQREQQKLGTGFTRIGEQMTKLGTGMTGTQAKGGGRGSGSTQASTG